MGLRIRSWFLCRFFGVHSPSLICIDRCYCQRRKKRDFDYNTYTTLDDGRPGGRPLITIPTAFALPKARNPQWMDYEGEWHDFLSKNCPACGELIDGATSELDLDGLVNWHLVLHCKGNLPGHNHIDPRTGLPMKSECCGRSCCAGPAWHFWPVCAIREVMNRRRANAS